MRKYYCPTFQFRHNAHLLWAVIVVHHVKNIQIPPRPRILFFITKVQTAVFYNFRFWIVCTAVQSTYNLSIWSRSRKAPCSIACILFSSNCLKQKTIWASCNLTRYLIHCVFYFVPSTLGGDTLEPFCRAIVRKGPEKVILFLRDIFRVFQVFSTCLSIVLLNRDILSIFTRQMLDLRAFLRIVFSISQNLWNLYHIRLLSI